MYMYLSDQDIFGNFVVQLKQLLVHFSNRPNSLGASFVPIYQRTNGPVNAHLKPEIYTNKTRMVISMYITPGLGQSNPLSQFLFENIKLQSICQFTESFALQMTFNNFPNSNAWAK